VTLSLPENPTQEDLNLIEQYLLAAKKKLRDRDWET